MVYNLLKVTIRLIARNKSLFFINVTGLSVGVGSFLILMMYVGYELTFDRQHPDYERIYRLRGVIVSDNLINQIAITPAGYGPAMKEHFPQIEDFFRITVNPFAVANEEADIRFNEDRFGFADSSFFRFFEFPLRKGDPRTALAEPYSVVLTPEAARRYFGDTDPMGKTLRVASALDFTVTGVLQEAPRHTHLDFDLLASFSTLYSVPAKTAQELGLVISLRLERKGFSAYYTYFRLARGADPSPIEAGLPAFVEKYAGEGKSKTYQPDLQPMQEIHLTPGARFELTPASSYITVYSFLTIALVILFVACVNYTNLSTAHYTLRGKEIGIKKVLGSGRLSLAMQFLFETYVVTAVAFVCALGLVAVLLPLFNSAFRRDLGLTMIFQVEVFPYVLSVFAGLGLVCGVYPAVFLSGFRPLSILKGEKISERAGDLGVRKGLVVFQFVVSLALIAATLIVYSQLDFIRKADRGFSSLQTIYVPLRFADAGIGAEALRTELQKVPGVGTVSLSSSIIGKQQTFLQSAVYPSVAEGDKELRFSMPNAGVDPEFIPAMKLKLIAGRNFAGGLPDTVDEFIINETAARILHEKDPLGMRIKVANPLGTKPREGEIIGVVEDFNFASLHNAVEPFIFFNDARTFGYVYLKVTADALEGIKKKWGELLPSTPFDYRFLDDDFNELYAEEVKLSALMNYFSVLAIFISSLGLWGLAAFSVERKKKEMGIRKVLGASVSSLAGQQLRQYLLFVLTAVVIAVPLCSYLVERWLNTFAFRVDISAWYFVASTAVVATLTLVTVLYHVLNAANSNPVKVLREQ